MPKRNCFKHFDNVSNWSDLAVRLVAKHLLVWVTTVTFAETAGECFDVARVQHFLPLAGFTGLGMGVGFLAMRGSFQEKTGGATLWLIL